MYDNWKQQTPPEREHTITFHCVFCCFKTHDSSEMFLNKHHEPACLKCKEEITAYEKEHDLKVTFN